MRQRRRDRHDAGAHRSYERLRNGGVQMTFRASLMLTTTPPPRVARRKTTVVHPGAWIEAAGKVYINAGSMPLNFETIE